MHTYVYAPTTNKGRWCPSRSSRHQAERGDRDHARGREFKAGKPIVSHHGDVTCQDAGGNPVEAASLFVLPAGHGTTTTTTAAAACNRRRCGSNRAGAHGAAAASGDGAHSGRAYWLALSYKAMVMDVAMAIRVYRQLGDAGMVMGLERLLGIEDKNYWRGTSLPLRRLHESPGALPEPEPARDGARNGATCCTARAAHARASQCRDRRVRAATGVQGRAPAGAQDVRVRAPGHTAGGRSIGIADPAWVGARGASWKI